MEPDAAVGSGITGSFESCEEAEAVFLSIVDQVREDLDAPCEVDEDCTLLEPRVVCDEREVLIVDCAIPLLQSGAEALSNDIEELRAPFCEAAPAGCRALAGCAGARPVCIDANCVAVLDE